MTDSQTQSIDTSKTCVFTDEEERREIFIQDNSIFIRIFTFLVDHDLENGSLSLCLPRHVGILCGWGNSFV